MPNLNNRTRRIRPHITGICIATGLVAFAALRYSPRVYVQGLRWLAAGVGIAAFATHLLQRVDESLDSRRRARHRKLQFLSQIIENQKVTKHSAKPDDAGLSLDTALDSPVHFNESPFEDREELIVNNYDQMAYDKNSGAGGSAGAPVDFRVAFEEAMLDGNWLSASEAYRASMEAGEVLTMEEAELAKLRKSSLDFIFHRMHSGTVKDDVASLARNITQIFPLSMEGRTLAPVLGVLRRSAGLCPRCEKPYRGVANACHDCLRGTAEAYQIAWDDQPL